MEYLAVDAELLRCCLITSGGELEVHLTGLPQVGLAEADLQPSPLRPVALEGGSVRLRDHATSCKQHGIELPFLRRKAQVSIID